ncbi:MAG: immunity protein Imm33 domain-containing protein [Arenicella sp.]
MNTIETPESWNEHAPLVMVTNLCIGPNRERIRFIFREEPNNDADSGWVFFCGYEPPGYADDSSNFSICPLKSILEIEPELAALVNSPIGSAWEKTPESTEWIQVDNFQYEDA